jgi:hypothetical protein
MHEIQVAAVSAKISSSPDQSSGVVSAGQVHYLPGNTRYGELSSDTLSSFSTLPQHNVVGQSVLNGGVRVWHIPSEGLPAHGEPDVWTLDATGLPQVNPLVPISFNEHMTRMRYSATSAAAALVAGVNQVAISVTLPFRTYSIDASMTQTYEFGSVVATVTTTWTATLADGSTRTQVRTHFANAAALAIAEIVTVTTAYTLESSIPIVSLVCGFVSSAVTQLRSGEGYVDVIGNMNDRPAEPISFIVFENLAPGSSVSFNGASIINGIVKGSLSNIASRAYHEVAPEDFDVAALWGALRNHVPRNMNDVQFADVKRYILSPEFKKELGLAAAGGFLNGLFSTLTKIGGALGPPLAMVAPEIGLPMMAAGAIGNAAGYGTQESAPAIQYQPPTQTQQRRHDHAGYNRQFYHRKPYIPDHYPSYDDEARYRREEMFPSYGAMRSQYAPEPEPYYDEEEYDDYGYYASGKILRATFRLQQLDLSAGKVSQGPDRMLYVSDFAMSEPSDYEEVSPGVFVSKLFNDKGHSGELASLGAVTGCIPTYVTPEGHAHINGPSWILSAYLAGRTERSVSGRVGNVDIEGDECSIRGVKSGYIRAKNADGTLVYPGGNLLFGGSDVIRVSI